jgi:hypothetical protein
LNSSLITSAYTDPSTRLVVDLSRGGVSSSIQPPRTDDDDDTTTTKTTTRNDDHVDDYAAAAAKSSYVDEGGSIIGVGATKRLSAVRWGVTSSLLVAWILTIPVSAVLAGLTYWVIRLFQ